MKFRFWKAIALISLAHGVTQACIWDSKTLGDEQKKDPSLAEAILSPTSESPDTRSLTNRIQRLRSAPIEGDAAWWNDLAGAYLRLGRPAEAVKLLEPLTNKFARDYGVHANLGTAYHLLGRYEEAEREISRDLEINPDAHFGLEKYHLALLQYLIRDEDYRLRHVYVDEFTASFLTESGYRVKGSGEGPYPKAGEQGDEAERKKEAEQLKATLRGKRTFSRAELYELGHDLCDIAEFDEAPKYRSHWNLAEDPKLDKGAMYMAGLNSREPSCWVMLGLLAVKHSDKNLTIAAFERAIGLGSPQASILQAQIDELRHHISEAQKQHREKSHFFLIAIVGLAVIVFVAFKILGKILPRSH